MRHETFKSPARHRRPRLWSSCYPEQPVCAVAGCGRSAHTVDAFFPYLDDHNRCLHHARPAAATVDAEVPRYLC